MHNAHSMLVNSEVDFERIYRAIRKYLLNDYSVVYSAEQASSVQVLQRLIQTRILPDAEDYIQNGMLIIVDESTVRRQKSQLNATELADLLFSTAAKARKKSGAKRVVVLCNSDVLLQNGDYSKQVEFEQAINRKFESKNRTEHEIICCYNSAKIEKLSLSYLILMVNAHTSIIDKDWGYSGWSTSIVMEIITRGIEKSLGFQTAQLILKTLKLIYKIDENIITSNPAVFEETLRKVIGENATEAVLASIKEEARRQIKL